MNAFFYDIESLQNVFTLCNFRENDNIVDVYVLCDNPELLDTPTLETDVSEAVLTANRNFNGTVRFFNLKQKDANLHLAKTFGLSEARMVNDPDAYDEYKKQFRLVCDTDPEYQGHEDEYPYLFGYNSYNYDTTMLALYLCDALMSGPGKKFEVEFNTLMKASVMRKYNDALFTPRFKPNMSSYLAYVDDEEGPANYNTNQWRIRKNMLLSGRHLDVARLNEKQQHVALKRLLGMLGFQILESDKLSGQDITIETYEQLLDLLAYNASDVINLAKLFQQKVYKSNFALKRGLLKTYPELIYEQKGATYKPDINPKRVRRDRLTIDSSSAQFATKALCPYGHLTDIPAVSFMYPSERIAKERGIPRRNILEETRTFFHQNFPQPELRREFDRIYNYYKSIEGRNFNESRNYQEDFGDDKPLGSQFVKAESISSVAETNTCLFYYNKDGTPSSCFVTFSTGGIHGAEYNKKLWEHDCRIYEQDLKLMAEVQRQYPNPIDLKKAKTVTIDGRSYAAKKFLTAKSTLKSAEYRDFSAKRPELFKEKQKGGFKLNDKYTFTSADPTNHEDFTSYYPNLLIAMSAFYNTQLGYDRYNEIFQNKQRFGKLMKDKSLPESEREDYAVQREGTKLVLNSASGAGDATFESNIRMNNQIISMRIIGQLFSYRIGQAQTLAGAKITSTNTDGLYSVLEKTVNDLILEREAATISVEIEPEPMYLITKDSNNRIEMNPDTGEILNASGGSLACRERPNPTKSLSHPAVLDWALTEYLIISALNYKNLSLASPFDRTIGMNILKTAEKTFTNRVHFLLMFQNVLASSTGSVSYIFGQKDGDETPVIMQHYNRVFILKDNTPGTMHLQTANARVITPLTARKRAKNDEAPRQPDPLAQYVLEQNGVSMKDIPENKEPIVKKITNVGPEWSMFIQNKDLNLLSDEEFAFIKDNLDYDKYLDLFQNAFEESWRNEDPVLDQE